MCNLKTFSAFHVVTVREKVGLFLWLSLCITIDDEVSLRDETLITSIHTWERSCLCCKVPTIHVTERVWETSHSIELVRLHVGRVNEAITAYAALECCIKCGTRSVEAGRSLKCRIGRQVAYWFDVELARSSHKTNCKCQCQIYFFHILYLLIICDILEC